ncbi:hypothetical protein DFH08DRAFT_799421 [Mycena albidolilacea]|uniref:Uncharacterized protein n=1 Tax=Mycena albidolilacea TaxID=1033008 RepID=A0AAD7F0X5_9AGAR|nr:hypothetical protein DFH08DRAFT_799421 [Mycena albidolilacea]
MTEITSVHCRKSCLAINKAILRVRAAHSTQKLTWEISLNPTAYYGRNTVYGTGKYGLSGGLTGCGSFAFVDRSLSLPFNTHALPSNLTFKPTLSRFLEQLYSAASMRPIPQCTPYSARAPPPQASVLKFPFTLLCLLTAHKELQTFPHLRTKSHAPHAMARITPPLSSRSPPTPVHIARSVAVIL